MFFIGDRSGAAGADDSSGKSEAQTGQLGSGNGGFDDGLIGGGGGSTGPTYTKEEIEKMKTEKERELRQLNLDLRQSDLNVRKLTADTENQSINSTINGVVKAVGIRKIPRERMENLLFRWQAVRDFMCREH